MKRALGLAAVLLTASVAGAAVFGGGGGGAGAVVDVLAELVGKNVNANSYTATNSSGPAFMSTGDRVDAVRLGTAPRATIGTCQNGSVCIGPDDLGYTTKLYVWGDIVTQMVQVRDSIDILGNASILNNNGPVRINDTDGLVINGTTALKGRFIVPVTFDSVPLSNNTCEAQVVTVPGVQDEDFVEVNARFQLPDGVGIQGVRATAADTVELILCNNTAGGSLDPAVGVYRFKLER